MIGYQFLYMEVIKLASYLKVNNDKLIILMAKNNLTVKELCKKANVFDGTLRNIKKHITQDLQQYINLQKL